MEVACIFSIFWYTRCNLECHIYLVDVKLLTPDDVRKRMIHTRGRLLLKN